MLGVQADGVFGPNTEKALKDFQQGNGLAVDGKIGPKTAVVLIEKNSSALSSHN